MLSLLLPILCNFCVLTTPDGFDYFSANGSVRTIADGVTRSDPTWGVVGSVVRTVAPTGQSYTIGGQFNGWAMRGVNTLTWGIATEAVADAGSNAPVVGIEALVANYGQDHTAPKIAVNAVYKSYFGDANTNSIAYWVSAYNTIFAQNGFETGIKFDRYSLKASPVKRAAVIDLSEIPLAELKDMDLIRLPNGKSLRWDGNGLSVYSQ